MIQGKRGSVNEDDKQNELLRFLAQSDRGVPAATLAGILGVSERTVRNYVHEINTWGGTQISPPETAIGCRRGGTLPTRKLLRRITTGCGRSSPVC